MPTLYHLNLAAEVFDASLAEHLAQLAQLSISATAAALESVESSFGIGERRGAAADVVKLRAAVGQCLYFLERWERLWPAREADESDYDEPTPSEFVEALLVLISRAHDDRVVEAGACWAGSAHEVAYRLSRLVALAGRNAAGDDAKLVEDVTRLARRLGSWSPGKMRVLIDKECGRMQWRGARGLASESDSAPTGEAEAGKQRLTPDSSNGQPPAPGYSFRRERAVHKYLCSVQVPQTGSEINSAIERRRKPKLGNNLEETRAVVRDFIERGWAIRRGGERSGVTITDSGRAAWNDRQAQRRRKADDDPAHD